MGGKTLAESRGYRTQRVQPMVILNVTAVERGMANTFVRALFEIAYVHGRDYTTPNDFRGLALLDVKKWCEVTCWGIVLQALEDMTNEMSLLFPHRVELKDAAQQWGVCKNHFAQTMVGYLGSPPTVNPDNEGIPPDPRAWNKEMWERKGTITPDECEERARMFLRGRIDEQPTSSPIVDTLMTTAEAVASSSSSSSKKRKRSVINDCCYLEELTLTAKCLFLKNNFSVKLEKLKEAEKFYTHIAEATGIEKETLRDFTEIRDGKVALPLEILSEKGICLRTTVFADGRTFEVILDTGAPKDIVGREFVHLFPENKGFKVRAKFSGLNTEADVVSNNAKSVDITFKNGIKKTIKLAHTIPEFSGALIIGKETMAQWRTRIFMEPERTLVSFGSDAAEALEVAHIMDRATEYGENSPDFSGHITIETIPARNKKHPNEQVLPDERLTNELDRSRIAMLVMLAVRGIEEGLERGLLSEQTKMLYSDNLVMHNDETDHLHYGSYPFRSEQTLKSYVQRASSYEPFPGMPVPRKEEIISYLRDRWHAQPIWHRQVNKSVNELRRLRDSGQFTIVLPCNPKACWWRDVEDRLIDLPIPIPSSSPVVLMAFRLGTIAEAIKFREILPKENTLDIQAAGFKFGGSYHKFARQQLGFVIERVRKLALWDKSESFTPPKVRDEEPDPDEREDWYPPEETGRYAEAETDPIVIQDEIEKMMQHIRSSEMKETLQSEFESLLHRRNRIFGATELGSVKDFEVRIDVKPGWQATRARNRGGSSKFEEDEMSKQIIDLWRRTYIELSKSPVSSNIKMVPKPGRPDKLRLCTNLWRVNKMVMDIQEPMPTLREAFARDKLREARVFSVIDIRMGFWQLPIHPDSRWVTAFACPEGLFQWTVLPFGLKTAPALFTQAIRKMLSANYRDPKVYDEFGTADNFSFAYMDDIIIYSKNQEEHLKHVADIMRRIDEFGFKIQAEKCKFFQSSVKYLGHVVSEGKIKMDPEKVEIIRNWPKPETTASLHTFIATVGFYAPFFGKSFTEYAKSLREMVRKGDCTWTPESNKAFNAIRKMVTSESFVVPPDWNKTFHIDTDASKYAIGGCLYQIDDEGRKKPVMWMGRKLNGAEVNYPTRDQELLALLYSIEKARMYIYGRKFIVHSDNMNLLFLYDNDVEGRVARWAMKLTAYDFELKHIKGTANVVADGISRIAYKSPARRLLCCFARISLL